MGGIRHSRGWWLVSGIELGVFCAMWRWGDRYLYGKSIAARTVDPLLPLLNFSPTCPLMLPRPAPACPSLPFSPETALPPGGIRQQLVMLMLDCPKQWRQLAQPCGPLTLKCTAKLSQPQ